MGNKLRPAAKQNPKGFFEALPLRDMCAADIDSHERVQKFRDWAKRRASAQNTDIIGAKEGKFCNQIAEMIGAWPRLKIIAVERPIEDIAASMQKSGTFKRLDLDESRKFAARWIANRDSAIERMKPDVLRVQFSELVSDTKATIERIVAFLEIKPTPEQMNAALAFVEPSLHHNRRELDFQI